MRKDAIADLFYEQCAGTFSGHMANVPNNPVIFSLVWSATESTGIGGRAATKEEFAVFLREIADMLDEKFITDTD